MLLTLSQLRDAVGGCLLTAVLPEGQAAAALGSARLIPGEVLPGDVFWAVRGTSVEQMAASRLAFARGAAGVVVPQAMPVSPPAGRWTLLVADVEQSLCKLAAWRRDRFAGTVVAVAGGDGTSTCRGLIASVLAAAHGAVASPAAGRGRIGLALALLEVESHHDCAVLGAFPSARALHGAESQGGEPAHVMQFCRPQIAVLLEAGGENAIAEAEGLLDALPHDGWAVLAGDEPAFRKAAAGRDARIVWVGRGADCDLAATDVRCGAGQLQFRLRGERSTVPVWGRHHLSAALAAVAVAEIAGQSLGAAVAALGRHEPGTATRHVVRRGEATWICDDATAGREAHRAALDLLREAPVTGRRIVLCGDLPDEGQALRRFADDLLAVGGADALLACGPRAEELAQAARQAGMPRRSAVACGEPRETVRRLNDILAPGSVVLARGWRPAVLERVWRELERC